MVILMGVQKTRMLNRNEGSEGQAHEVADGNEDSVEN
jgi:hypothetical protein